jgi:hypothetical protein
MAHMRLTGQAKASPIRRQAYGPSPLVMPLRPAARRRYPPEAAGAPGTVTYGLNFQAWCVFLRVMHHVPVERCADILESMTGARPSGGWVHALLGRAAWAVAAANTTIRALIILARVVCGDETPPRSGPGPKTKKKYLQPEHRSVGQLSRLRPPSRPALTPSAAAAWRGLRPNARW